MPRLALAAAIAAAVLAVSAQAQAPSPSPAQKAPAAGEKTARQPSVEESLLMRAAQRLQRGDAPGALQDIEVAIGRDPNSSPAYALRGTIRMTVGRRADALADFTRAIQLTPDVKGMEVVYVNRANTYWLDGNLRAAEADLAKAFAMNPNFALAYNLRGRMKADANDLDGAISDFDRAIKIEPKMMPAYVARAAVNLQAGRLEQSISDYKTLMWVLPQDADIVASHGIVRGLMGETGPAIRDLIKAAVMNPKSVSTEPRGGAPAPVRRLDQYIEMNPNEARAHLIRGALSSMNGEGPRSEKEFERAVQLDPRLRFEVDAVRQGLANPDSTNETKR